MKREAWRRGRSTDGWMDYHHRDCGRLLYALFFCLFVLFLFNGMHSIGVSQSNPYSYLRSLPRYGFEGRGERQFGKSAGGLYVTGSVGN